MMLELEGLQIALDTAINSKRRHSTLVGASRPDSTHYPLIKVMARLRLIKDWTMY